MKQRRAFLLILLILLLVVGIPSGWIVHEYRQEQASRDLIAAIKANDAPAALAALAAGADPNIRSRPEDTPLSLGERLKQLFDHLLHPGAKPGHEDHYTALMLCIYNPERGVLTDNPEILAALLNAGADPNATTVRQETALMLAATKFTPHSLRLLLEHGANVHQKDDIGQTALHYGSSFFHGDGETVELLLNAGANIEEQNHNGRTPLYLACGAHNREAAEALLNHHAALNARDKDGNTCLDEAWWSNPSGAVPDDWAKYIARLVKAGAKTSKELSSHPSTAQKH